MTIDLRPTATEPRSRRAILAGALTGLAGLIAGRAATPDIARAASGDPLIIGSTANNAGTGNTTLTTSSTGTGLLITQNGTGTALRGSAVGPGSIAGFFTANNGTGISGVTGAGGSYGVFAQNNGIAGAAGALRANGGQNHGVVATTANANANAIVATSSAEGGVAILAINSNPGTDSTFGSGIRALSGGGTVADIHPAGAHLDAAGEFAGPNGVIGAGLSTGAGVVGLSPSGFAVFGQSDSGSGVRGLSASGDGVFGSSGTGAGVRGNATAGSAVHGSALSGYGIRGDATSGIGVIGSSQTYRGIQGDSTVNIGVAGYSVSYNGVHGTTQSGAGVYGDSNTGVGVFGHSASGYAFYGDADSVLAADLGVGGNLSVTGNLSKGGGTFKIDHPLDPANKFLYHSFVESPDMMNIYNGIATTDAKGEATVKLPAWFSPLNRDFRYQLTVVGRWSEAWISAEMNDNAFSIATKVPGTKVSWQLTGIRQDAWANAHRVVVEETKPKAEKGKYLHPKEHGQPESKGIGYAERKAVEAKLARPKA